MKTKFEQNLRKFQERPPYKLLSVKIGEQQYELQVNDQHTIKDVIQRYQRDKYLNSGQQWNIITLIVQGSTEVQIKNQLTKMKQLLKDNKASIRLKEQKRNTINTSKQASVVNVVSKQAKKQEVEIPYKRQSYPNPNINIPAKQKPNLSKLQSIQSPKSQQRISFSQLKQILSQKPAQKDPSKPPNPKLNQTKNQIKQYINSEYIRADKILKFLDNNRDNLPTKDKSITKKEQQIFNKLEEMLKAVMSNNLYEEFIDSLNRKIQEFKWYEKFKKQGGKSKSKVCAYGRRQTNILSTIENVAEQINNLIKKIPDYENSLKQKNKKLDEKDAQIEKLKQQKNKLSKLNRTNESQQSTTITLTQTKSRLLSLPSFIKLQTLFFNNPKYDEKMRKIQIQIKTYERYQIDCFFPLASLGKGDLYFDHIGAFVNSSLEKINGKKEFNNRILIILETERDGMIAVYSPGGIKKKGSENKLQEKKQSGFIVHFNEVKQKDIILNLQSTISQFVYYDEKTLCFTDCFRIFKNPNKRLSILYKNANSQNYWGEKGNKQLLEAFGAKKQSEIVGMEIYSLFFGSNQNSRILQSQFSR